VQRELSALNEDLERRVSTRTAELRTAMEAVELASRAKSEFLSSMSHELRTPLNGILGFAQLLSMAQPPLSVSEQRKVGQIETAGWHLLGLIDEVLDLARIESGAVGISMEPINVEWVVDETIALVATMARERGLTIVNQGTQNGAEHAPIWALANRRRLVQVLTNLLSNAIKYNRPHGVVTVSVSPSMNSSADGRMTISVADTGRGFTPEQLDRLYQPFTRFKREGDSIQGTGIGLVITRNLVQLMGGEMTVASVVDEGSIFTVDLAEAHAPLAVEVAETAAPNAANAPAPGEERRLLYVEDNPANVELFEQIIRMRSGYRLTVATDGLAGLALARAQMPHLAVVDIDLPGIDGVELCRRLRADDLTSGIPLIALSANAMGDDIARARNAGFDVYLTKPIDVIRLLAEIERLLPT
jgi:CheY-like chemotaxis protein